MDENQYSTSNAFHTVTPAMEPPAPARGPIPPRSVGGIRGRAPRPSMSTNRGLYFVFCFLFFIGGKTLLT